YINDERSNVDKGKELRAYASILSELFIIELQKCRASYDHTKFEETAAKFAVPKNLWSSSEGTVAASSVLDDTDFFHNYIEKVTPILSVGLQVPEPEKPVPTETEARPPTSEGLFSLRM